jgi:diguanylate cyclase (GGDEF)-like protein
MNRIFLIGNGLDDYHEALSIKGFDVLKFGSARTAIPRLKEAGLLIIEKGYKDFRRELLKSTKSIPKIIISADYSSKGVTQWLREPMSRHLYNPTHSELIQYIKRIWDEKTITDENNRLRHEIGLMKQELNFFDEINRALTSSLELNDVLVIIMKRVQEMTDAEAWSILLVDEETGDLVFERVEGNAKKKMRELRLKQGEGIAGWVAKEGIPVVVSDVRKDKRFARTIDTKTQFKTKSIMCVPIKSKGRVLGVLEVINKKSNKPFTEEDMKVLMKLVDQAALAVERAMLYQKMEELAITDDLTKLFNTRYLNRTIETEVLRSKRYNASVSLIFMDIDYFKHINDNYGHLVGSKVLVEMGQLLIKCLRNVDIVARYGGDEFVIVLPQTTPQDAVMTAERIRKTIAQHTFLKREGYGLKITASFGVCSYPEAAKTKEELLRLADEAMYRVKHDTRNGVYAII